MPPYDHFKFDSRFLFTPTPFAPRNDHLLKSDEQIERELGLANAALAGKEYAVKAKKDALASAEANRDAAKAKRDALKRESDSRKRLAKSLKDAMAKLEKIEKYCGTLLIEDANGSKYLVKDVKLDSVREGLDRTCLRATKYLIVSTGCNEANVGVWKNLPGSFVAEKVTKVCG